MTKGTMGKYVMGVDELLKANWHENDNVQEKWNVLKFAVCEGTEAELSYVKVNNQIGLEILLRS